MVSENTVFKREQLRGGWEKVLHNKELDDLWDLSYSQQLYSSALKMEGVRSSETLVNFSQTVRRHIKSDSNLYYQLLLFTWSYEMINANNILVSKLEWRNLSEYISINERIILKTILRK
jgi:hypothetical protein